MAKRQIKDALVNGESVYFKGHAQATYMSSGITVEDAINNIGANIDLTNYATKTYVDKALLDKQNIISDLETIRSGAALGNTAVQPAAISNKADKTEIPTKLSQLENDANYIVTHDLNVKQDTLISGTNIKTINGTSILGSGNIVISGGSGGSSSGGSGAYAEVNHGTSDTTFTLTPNTFHVWDEVTSLDLSFADEQAGVANEYLFQFTSGATATTLTLPDVKWVNDVTPEIISDKLYLISILNNMASIMEFNNSIFPYTLYFYEDQETPAERNPNSLLLYTKLLEMINSGLNPSTLVIVVSSGPYFMGYTPFTISTITNKPGIIIADVGARMYYYILQEDGSITYYDYD